MEIRLNTETGEARDPNGNTIGADGRIQTPAQTPSPSAPIGPRIERSLGGEVRYRDGVAEVRMNTPIIQPQHQADEGGDILSTAKTTYGSPVVGRAIGRNDTVVVDGSRTSVAAAITMGYLAMDAQGNIIVPESGPDGSDEKPSTESEDPTSEILRLSDEGEESMTALTKASQGAQFAGIEDVIAHGEVSEATVKRMASDLGCEPEEVAAHITRIQSAYDKRLAATVKGVGVHDFEMFKEWLWSEGSRSGEAGDAVRQLLRDGPATQMIGLAERFVEDLDTIDPDAVRDACADAGVKVENSSQHKGLLLTLPNGEQVLWKVAVRNRLFTVRRG